MNSSAWPVSSGAERYRPQDLGRLGGAGLQVAAWLDGTGTPHRRSDAHDGSRRSTGGAAPVRGRAPAGHLARGRRGAGARPSGAPTRCSSERRCRGPCNAGPGRGSTPDGDRRPRPAGRGHRRDRCRRAARRDVDARDPHGDPAPEAFLAGGRRCRADRLGEPPAMVRSCTTSPRPGCTPATSSSPHTGGPRRSRPMSWRPSPCYWPSGGPSRRGTSRGESDGAISPGCCPTRTTTKASADARRALLGSAS